MSAPRLAPAAPRWLRTAFSLLLVLAVAGPLAAEAVGWFNPDGVPIPAELDGESLDSPAPDFVLNDMAGRPVRLSDLRGKTVFLNFWATWCPPCVEELPSMLSLYGAMRGRDFEIVAVSEDESIEDVRAFFGGFSPGFKVVMDEDQATTREYGTFKFPETFVIDRDGRIRAKFVGPRGWDGPESVAYFERLTR